MRHAASRIGAMSSSLSHRPIVSAALVVCAAASLALTGCSNSDNKAEGSSPASSSTSVAADNQESSQPSQSSSATTSTSNSGAFFSGEATPAQTSEPKSPAPSQSSGDAGKQITNQLVAGLAVGDKLQIGSVSTTACVVGDGYGTHVWAAGPNTSCDFAQEVGDALTKPLNATTENVRATMPQTVKASSPATGQSYDMVCTVDAAKVVTCRGGNNASVYLY